MTDPTPDRSHRAAYLAGLARARIAAARAPYASRGLTWEQEETAADVLADVWAAGERHGISPETWSWVADLPACVLSLISWRALGRKGEPRSGR